MGTIQDIETDQRTANTKTNATATDTKSSADTASKIAKADSIFTKLMTIDPMRHRYYESVKHRLLQQLKRVS
jgi:hypothetical protein